MCPECECDLATLVDECPFCYYKFDISNLSNVVLSEEESEED